MCKWTDKFQISHIKHLKDTWTIQPINMVAVKHITGTLVFPFPPESVLYQRLRRGASLCVAVILRLVRSVCAAAARIKVSQKICLMGWIKNLCNPKQDHTDLWCQIILTLDLTLWHQWIFCRCRNVKYIIPVPSSGVWVRFNTTGHGQICLGDGHFKDCGNCEDSFGFSRRVRPEWLTYDWGGGGVPKGGCCWKNSL